MERQYFHCTKKFDHGWHGIGKRKERVTRGRAYITRQLLEHEKKRFTRGIRVPGLRHQAMQPCYIANGPSPLRARCICFWSLKRISMHLFPVVQRKVDA